MLFFSFSGPLQCAKVVVVAKCKYKNDDGRRQVEPTDEHKAADDQYALLPQKFSGAVINEESNQQENKVWKGVECHGL